MMDGYFTITREFIEQGRTGAGGWKRAQAALLGLAWPLPKGWQNDVIGSVIPETDAALFLSLRGDARSISHAQRRRIAQNAPLLTVTLTHEQHRALMTLLKQLQHIKPG